MAGGKGGRCAPGVALRLRTPKMAAGKGRRCVRARVRLYDSVHTPKMAAGKGRCACERPRLYGSVPYFQDGGRREAQLRVSLQDFMVPFHTPKTAAGKGRRRGARRGAADDRRVRNGKRVNPTFGQRLEEEKLTTECM
ncbi:hypothetical protein NDU88_007577 [Pleurodeles waltl]|uniref:Uncharacterized protein n=1 Tax=Pleurodeles waltl TaxID=8319 RepID=A0AAV7WDZ5_PLEWA|nr:hypothetical protein NDU88_007577 [Pleurodeles waltl]